MIISIKLLSYLQDRGVGVQKTKVFVLNTENTEEIKKNAYEHIWFGSEIHADENIAYDDLGGAYNLKRVDHSEPRNEFAGYWQDNKRLIERLGG